MNRTSQFCILLIAVLCVSVASARDARTIRFSCLSTPDMPDHQYAKALYKKAFKSLGYRFEMVPATTSQTVELLRRGAVDGDCGRTEGFLELPGLPEVIRTEHTMRQSYFAAWTLAGFLQPDVLKVENRGKLVIGFVSGRAFIEALAEQMGFTRRRAFASLDQGLEALRSGDIDVWLDYEAVFSGDRAHLLGDDIRIVGPVATAPVYPWLLKRHAQLVPRLSKEIARITNAKPYLHDFDTRDIPVATGKNMIRFGCSLSDKVPQFIEFENHYRKAFGALGYNFKMISMPIVRAETELMAERIDGSCGRGSAFFARNPGAVKVAVNIYPTTLQAWSRDPMMRITDVSSFNRRGMLLGYVRGTHLATEVLSFYPYELLIPVLDAAVGMKMLSAGRIDVFVDSAPSVQSSVQWLNLKKPLYMVGDFYLGEIYPALRPGLQHLAEPLAEALLKNRSLTMRQYQDDAAIPR